MKTKEQKRHEASLRALRGTFVHQARHLDWYKRDVRARVTMFHRDDMRYHVQRMRTAINTLRHECTDSEIAELFRGWSIPERYKQFIPKVATPHAANCK